MKKIGFYIKRFLLIILGLLLLFLAYFFWAIQIPVPKIDRSKIHPEDLKKVNDSCYVYEDAWLRKNRLGLWEMYISGSPEELGIKNGILSQHLIHAQEEAFVKQIKRMIPSDSYLKFLKYITAYMNRELPDYIPQEYLIEIKAVSLFASHDFDFIGDNYTRQLNYHAAHDIGHAMQNLHLVECTAFGVWANRSQDSSLLIGRNFDFYVGDEFAKNKIVLFVKPDQGIPFASITWGGMIGVVSGINEQGLSITLNSAKGNIPLTAKTPVSIIARQILQYASNIQEAYEIAKKHPSFVSESFMIGSAYDHRTAIIEKTPDTTVLYQVDNHHIVLTNHFQSTALFSTKINQENMEENVTTYRFNRVEELLAGQDKFNEKDFAGLLRDDKGLGNADIGLGNEGAVNQLIAHHSIIFKPMQKEFYISTKPYQLGAYLAYQLDSVFAKPYFTSTARDLIQQSIPADSLFLSSKYQQFLKYKATIDSIHAGVSINEAAFIATNPVYFSTYEILGDYSEAMDKPTDAQNYYSQALQCFVPNKYERKRIEQKIQKITQ